MCSVKLLTNILVRYKSHERSRCILHTDQWLDTVHVCIISMVHDALDEYTQ